MVRDLITLPIRIGAGVTRLGLRVAGEAFTLGWKATERLVEGVVPRPGGPPVSPDVAEASDSVRVDVRVAPPLQRVERTLEPAPAPSAHPNLCPPHPKPTRWGRRRLRTSRKSRSSWRSSPIPAPRTVRALPSMSRSPGTAMRS